MRPLLLCLMFAAACGDSDDGITPPPPPPPPPGAFDCLGDPLPTTAPDPVIVTGFVTAGVTAPSALEGAVVEGFETGDATAIATDTTDAAGRYSITLPTGGTPLDGYVRVRKSGYIDTYGYPPVPISANVSQSVLMVTASELGFIGTLAGVTQTAGNGMIGMVVVNCNGDPIAGAIVSTNPAGTYRYNSGGAPSPSATSTAADGVAYVFNVAAGDVVVMATAGANVLRHHTVNARADVVTLTAVAP